MEKWIFLRKILLACFDHLKANLASSWNRRT
jgi:hypothetical protein